MIGEKYCVHFDFDINEGKLLRALVWVENLRLSLQYWKLEILVEILISIWMFVKKHEHSKKKIKKSTFFMSIER